MIEKEQMRTTRNKWFFILIAGLSLLAVIILLAPFFSLLSDASDTLLRSWEPLPGIGSNLAQSLWLVLIVILVSTPASFGMAIWMFSYANERTLSYVRQWLGAFAMLPAVLLGLLARALLAPYLSTRLSMAILMGLFILPYQTLGFEEALSAAPKALPEAGMLLGISKTAAVYRLVVPSIAKDLLRCCITCVERVLGEATALLALLGAVPMGNVISVELFRLTWIGRQDAALLAFCLGACLMLLRLLTADRWASGERAGRRHGRDIWQRD